MSRYTHEIGRQMTELRRAGMVFWKIGAQLGYPQGTVLRWIAKYEGHERQQRATDRRATLYPAST